MSAFCVETQDRALVFAALKDDCVSWVGKLCHSTFKVGPIASPSPPSGPGGTSSTLSLCLSQKGVQPGSSQLCMEENQIYASADQGDLAHARNCIPMHTCPKWGGKRSNIC